MVEYLLGLPALPLLTTLGLKMRAETQLPTYKSSVTEVLYCTYFKGDFKLKFRQNTMRKGIAERPDQSKT